MNHSSLLPLFWLGRHNQDQWENVHGSSFNLRVREHVLTIRAVPHYKGLCWQVVSSLSVEVSSRRKGPTVVKGISVQCFRVTWTIYLLVLSSLIWLWFNDIEYKCFALATQGIKLKKRNGREPMGELQFYLLQLLPPAPKQHQRAGEEEVYSDS